MAFASAQAHGKGDVAIPMPERSLESGVKKDFRLARLEES
jgi:hypothetical protein